MNDTVFRQARLARVRALKLSRLARTPALWPAVRSGVVPSVEHADVPFRPRYGTVLDVGASRGQFALFASNRFPEAELICFEPLPEPRAILTQLLAGRAEVRGTAVGAEGGTAELHVSASDDSSSLLPIGERQVAEFPGTQETGTVIVDVVRLADVVHQDMPGPRLLKIDVQGLELEVLKGLGEQIRLIDDVFVECSFTELYEGQALADEVISFLLSNGLRLVGVNGAMRATDGAVLQADLFFRRGSGT
ncbi:FkbM family methyltransferase [Svornostia abyssi]|uniref:FkbM family methyltransferase n=1 Tax=Svornostia abyssi TaxID=2898438 RepID=A0ABY5PER3_9ACTN|nr:FkbM family methyltransferase [Parviterribacteraceae bacterium J379]